MRRRETMSRTEKEIRNEIANLRKKLKELESLLKLYVEKGEAKYIFILHEDSLTCEKYASGDEYYFEIDRITLNKLFSWLIDLKAIKLEK